MRRFRLYPDPARQFFADITGICESFAGTGHFPNNAPYARPGGLIIGRYLNRHIVYHVKGGANTAENLVTLCNVHRDEVHSGVIEL